MKTYKIPKAQKITQNKHKNWCCSVEGWLEFNVPFQHKTAISEAIGQGWRVIFLPSEERLAIY